MLKQGEPFKARAYSNAKESLLEITTDIESLDYIKGKKGIGKSVLDTLKEFIDTGKVGVIERERNNPVNILGDIYGVGPKKAKELVEKNGIKTIEELRTKQDELLNDKQKIGLKYYEDIQKRIPRKEIEEFAKVFENIFKQVSKKDKNALIKIVSDAFLTRADLSKEIILMALDELMLKYLPIEALAKLFAVEPAYSSFSKI